MPKKQKGFTIVELLIVVVVIAILAAISVVAYTGIQNRGYNSVVESDTAAIVRKMELVKAELGHYPQTRAEFPSGFKFSKSAYDHTANNVYYLIDIANDRYAFGLRSRTGKAYLINTGVVTYPSGVNGSTLTGALGVAWDDIPGVSYTIQGYVGSTSTWSTSWGWTN